MLFRQYLHQNPVAISYLFGCGTYSKGIVVDPLEDLVSFYIEESEKLSMPIVYIIDTHLHADHISGARKLAEKTGAQYLLHCSSDAAFSFTSVEEGDLIDAGNTIVKVLHTPGHTPEHISLVVTDHRRGIEPWFVVTGHTLMPGDVGRTELATSLEEGAAALYESLFKKLLSLPDYMEIYAGAFLGSVCGRKLSGKPVSTIGFEKRFNQALRHQDKNEFISNMTRNVPPPPENYQKIRQINMGK